MKQLTYLSLRIGDQWNFEANSLDRSDMATLKAASIFQSCPETIALVKTVDACIDFDTETTLQPFPSIKSLIFERLEASAGMDAFISNHFPSLVSLSIKLNAGDLDTFQFPNHHFSFLEFNLSEVYGFNYILTTLKDGKSRCYNTDSRIYRASKQLQFDNSYIAPLSDEEEEDGDDNEWDITYFDYDKTIKILCGSVKEMHLNNLFAYLDSI
jgi:hypothetical protein